jgi:hypothetical protein
VVFTSSLVLDGNFKLSHLKQKRPEDDVWLADGHGMMMEQEPYLLHLATAIEIQQVRMHGHESHHILFTKRAESDL